MLSVVVDVSHLHCFQDYHCSALHSVELLWLLLTSYNSSHHRWRDCSFSEGALVRPPRVSLTTFLPYRCWIYCRRLGQYRTLFCVANSSISNSLLSSFCSSPRDFASGFLQILSHPKHPCLSLTVPTAKPVADFHRLAVRHAGHTQSPRLCGAVYPVVTSR